MGVAFNLSDCSRGRVVLALPRVLTPPDCQTYYPQYTKLDCQTYYPLYLTYYTILDCTLSHLSCSTEIQ